MNEVFLKNKKMPSSKNPHHQKVLEQSQFKKKEKEKRKKIFPSLKHEHDSCKDSHDGTRSDWEESGYGMDRAGAG